jgi:peptidoglycan/xylan/chitin deacetylase (PgdA/CDA1 family)
VSSHRPTILAYHAVTHLANDPNGAATSPERLESQLLYLKRHNLQGVSVRELRRAIIAGKDSRKLVAITFDDGYEDFLHTALPMLERFGFSATVFVVAGMLGKENNWEHVYEPRPRMKILEAEGLREVATRGIEVGSHSMTHRNLANLDSLALEQEVNDSCRILSEVWGEAVEGFSYPYGSFSYATVQAVRQGGYAYACAWNTNSTNVRGRDMKYHLLRIPVSEKDNTLRFGLKLRAYWPLKVCLSPITAISNVGGPPRNVGS